MGAIGDGFWGNQSEALHVQRAQIAPIHRYLSPFEQFFYNQSAKFLIVQKKEVAVVAADR